MNYIQAVILAIIEGLTEFLPISSTGHLIIGASLMKLYQSDPAFTKLFTICVQLGAILSVVVLYWRRFLQQSLKFYINIAIATLPILGLGYLLKDQIDLFLGDVKVVAVMLLVGGVVLLFIDRLLKANEGDEPVMYPGKALIIGLFQCIALIPGVSRAAATIIGGMAQGLSRRAAAEYSFFLAVPAMGAATLYKLYKGRNLLDAAHLPVLAIGNIVAFVVALIAIRSFLGFVSKHSFAIFGWYRIALGGAILILLALGYDLQVG